MTQVKYTGRQDVIQKRIIKKDGVLYKQSLLEIWHAKGWLEYEQSCYSSDDRLRFGLRLALDYHMISRANLHSGFLFNNKIDSPGGIESKRLLDAQNSYRRAIRAVPPEFWPIVRQICIDEKELIAPSKWSERQKAYFYYLCRIDLCRGLDRIIKAYMQPQEKTSP